MLRRIWRWLVGKPETAPQPATRAGGLFTTDEDVRARQRPRQPAVLTVLARIPGAAGEVATMDDSNEGMGVSVKPIYGSPVADIPEAQVLWYASQGFIGYQLCAILAQHWLIDKACTMPAQDAVRKGYDISINDTTKVGANIITFIKRVDKRMRINAKMIDYVRFGRVFGIRLALFVVDSPDPEYYEKPFNIDGVGPACYKGISLIDPYWITPELTSNSALEPGNMHFYEPEFWRVGGRSIHRSHFSIFTTGEVADVLKPSYFFGGVSVPQRIFERVYAAERTANEAPQLAMTKRLTTMNTDLSEAVADQQKFDDRMSWWRQTLDNYGVKINGLEDKMQQFDISLSDLGDVIMTQYQIVAAIAGVPGTKLLGTQPKGFNSTGEFEESSYHEFLETIEDNDLTPMLDRHHELVVKSYVCPKFGCEPFDVTHSWNELDAMTSLEQAQLNLVEAELDAVLISNGIIESIEARQRIIADPDSGYSGLSDQPPPMPDEPNMPTPPPAAPAAPPKPTMPRAAKMPGA